MRLTCHREQFMTPRFDPYPGWGIDDQDTPTTLVNLPQAVPSS